MDSTWWISDSDLDAHQREAIRLSLDQNHLVLGPPGSGKTNLLLLRAKYLTLAGKGNIVVLTFTSALRDFLVRGAEKYRLPSNRITTVNSWLRQHLRELGGEAALRDLPEDFQAARAELSSRLLGRVQAGKIANHFDCILVDEAQDLSATEVDLVQRLGSTMFAVGDQGQKIYDTEDVLDALESSMSTVRLRFHYRSAPEICRIADAIAGATAGITRDISATCNYRDSAEANVERLVCETFDEQIQRLIDRVTTQCRAYPDEPIAIACPRRQQVGRIRDALRQSPLAGALADNDSIDDSGNVYVSTIHSLKGLEFRAVNLVGLEELSAALRGAIKRGSHMAITRARTSLVAYWTGNVPAWLDSAFGANNAPAAPPNIDELF